MNFSVLNRDFGVFCRCLIPAAALTLVFILVCSAAAMSAINGAEEFFAPVKVAVVDEEDSILSRLVVNMVSGMEDFEALLEIEKYNRDEAQTAIKTGEAAAVIVLPENFLVDITSGKNSRGQIILSPAAASNSDVVEAVAVFGEAMLAAGQYGVFAGQHLIWELELESGFETRYLEGVNKEILAEALNAGKGYFDIEVTDYDGTNMSAEAYYGANWLSFILFISAIPFVKLCRGDMDRAVVSRLTSVGVKDKEFLLGKFLFPIIFRMILLAGALCALSAVLELDFSILSVLCALLAAIVMGTIGSGLCTAFPAGAGITALLGIFGIFLCGGVIPRQMLPDGVIALGQYTPFGAAQSLAAPLFGGEVSAAGLLLSVIYSGIALLLAFDSIRKLRGGGA